MPSGRCSFLLGHQILSFLKVRNRLFFFFFWSILLGNFNTLPVLVTVVMPRFISLAQSSSLVYQYIQLLTWHITWMFWRYHNSWCTQPDSWSFFLSFLFHYPSHSRWQPFIHLLGPLPSSYRSLFLSNLSPRPITFIISISIESYFSLHCYLHSVLGYHYLLSGPPNVPPLHSFCSPSNLSSNWSQSEWSL